MMMRIFIVNLLLLKILSACDCSGAVSAAYASIRPHIALFYETVKKELLEQEEKLKEQLEIIKEENQKLRTVINNASFLPSQSIMLNNIYLSSKNIAEMEFDFYNMYIKSLLLDDEIKTYNLIKEQKKDISTSIHKAL